jgi:hypothetical protein
MYTQPTISPDDHLEYLLQEALKAPMLGFLANRGLSIGIYSIPVNKGDVPVAMKVSTEVEKLLLSLDVVLTVSDAETQHLDDYNIIALLAQELSAIELTWRGGRDDPSPVILISHDNIKVNPEVARYFPNSIISNRLYAKVKIAEEKGYEVYPESESRNTPYSVINNL